MSEAVADVPVREAVLLIPKWSDEVIANAVDRMRPGDVPAPMLRGWFGCGYCISSGGKSEYCSRF